MHSRADAYLAILPEEQAVLGIVVCWTGSHKDLDLAHRAVTRVKISEYNGSAATSWSFLFTSALFLAWIAFQSGWESIGCKFIF